MTGRTYTTWGTPIRAYTAGIDGFAAKIDTDGNLVWNTFLGGSQEDQAGGVAVDGSGNVYVTGQSYATWGSPIRAYTAGEDGYVAKLDSGGSLIWNTFQGGGGDDLGASVVLAGSGGLYLQGYSSAAWGTPIAAYTALLDAYAAKLDSGGNLIWNTFVGGSGTDYANSLVLDGTGGLSIMGYSNAAWGSPVRAYTAGNDAFVARIAAFPTVTTTAVSSLGPTSASSGGNVTSDAGDAVTARGVCWSTAANPTTADSKTIDGSGTGAFTSNLTGLTPNTPYHIRAYATNGEGTGYGGDLTFTTPVIPAPTVTVTSPNGGESWAWGSSHNIAWTSTGTIANVKIEYSTNNGTGWTTIIASTANTGSYAWTVPYTSSTQCLVRVSDASNAAIFDVSNAVFRFMSDSTEPNDDSASAAVLPMGTTDNLIYTEADIDWYKFFVPPADAGKDLKVNVRMTSPYPDPPPANWGSDIDFELLDGALGVRGVVFSGSDNETLYLPNVTSGWYYIYIAYGTINYADSSTYGRYSISLEAGTNFGLGYISGRVVDGVGQGIEKVFLTLTHFPDDWTTSFPAMTAGAGATLRSLFCRGLTI